MNEIEPGKPPRLFAAGGAHIDRRGRCAGAYRPGASNPGVLRETVGGAAFNALRALVSLGGEACLVSGRGGDRTGAEVGEAVEALGIEDMAATWLDRRTPSYTAILDDAGDLVAGLADMALYDLMGPRVFRRRHIREAMDGADAVLVDANLPEATIRRLAEDTGNPVFAIAVSPAKVVRLAAVVGSLAAVFLSRTEAAALAGLEPDAPFPVILTALAGMGCRRAVVTDGPRPAAILDGDRIVRQAPRAVASLRDVTGAGDTLAGVAVFALLSGWSFSGAARLGMAGASLHVSNERRPGDFTLATLRAIAAAMPQPTADEAHEPMDLR